MFFKNKKIEHLEKENANLKQRLEFYKRYIDQISIELTYAKVENYDLKKNVKKSKKRT